MSFWQIGFEKVISGLKSTDSNIQLPALTLLTDQVHNSQKAFCLINRNVIKILNTVINQSISESQKLACVALQYLCNLYSGSKEIVNDENLVKKLKTMAQNTDIYDIKVEALRCLRILCTHPLFTHIMAKKYSMTALLLKHILKDTDEVKEISLNCLTELLKTDQEAAIKNDGISKMINLVTSENKSIKHLALRALGLMIEFLEVTTPAETKNNIVETTIMFLQNIKSE